MKRDIKEKFLKSLEKHLGIVTPACKEVNISRQTFYRWCNEDEDFKVDGTYTANTQTIMSDLKNEKEGVYVLKGGLEKNGRWNEDSLQKGEPVYYTTDTTDPKLKSFQEDGMVWVTIENGEMEVVEY